MQRPIHRRAFIGGCSRSGTTLLQRLLAGHSRVHTFPETGVFLRALGMRGRVLPWTRLGLTLGKERKSLVRLQERLDPTEGPLPSLPPRRAHLRSSAEDVVLFLDALTRRAGKDVWVEKTPRHVLHASRIRRLVPCSLFIHMVRDGRDVVASIVDRARKYPDRFPGQEDPAYGVRQWNRSLRATATAMKEPGHVVLRYEGLTARPEETLKALCRLLGISFEDRMTEEGGLGDFVLPDERWKAPREGPLRPAPSKFGEIFEEDEKKRINEGLALRTLESMDQHLQEAQGGVWASDPEC